MRYAIAQGLIGGQRVLVLDSVPERVVGDTMWLPRGSSTGTQEEKEEKKEEDGDGEKIKIAWRYEGMKQFRTTVEDGKSVCESPCAS